MPDPRAERRRTIAWWTFVALAAILLPIMLRASLDFGVTWDEKSRHKYGELIWEFLRGLRSRDSFSSTGSQLYGGLFDTLCAAIEGYIPLDRYVLRHLLNATFGWVGIVYAGRLATRLFDRWAGVLTMVLLAASPRYFAHSMNNPKDLPFAAATVVALYYIATISREWPYVSPATGLKIAVPIAVALNIRAAALLYLGYFGLLIGAYVVADIFKHVMSWRRLADTTVRVAAVSAATLLLGTIFWPWAQASPFTRPIVAMLGLANFPYIAGMLFNGRVVITNALPWTYAPWYFLISTPPVVLAGVLLALAPRDRRSMAGQYLLWSVALFPIVAIIARHSTLYDGIRHLLFVYPLFVTLAAAGWTAWLSPRHRPLVRGTAAALLIAGFANVMVFNVRSYPNQSAYFNELVGGPRGAFARYDMDYWGNCMLEAVAWSANLARQAGMPVTVSGNPWHLVQLDAERFHELYFTLPQRRTNYLDIRLNRGSVEGVEGLATRPDALYRVRTADGAVLCVVVPGPAFDQLKAHLPAAALTVAAGR